MRLFTASALNSYTRVVRIRIRLTIWCSNAWTTAESSASTSLNTAPGIAATTQCVRASMPADRGPPSIAAISPNISPGPRSVKVTTVPDIE